MISGRAESAQKIAGGMSIGTCSVIYTTKMYTRDRLVNALKAGQSKWGFSVWVTGRVEWGGIQRNCWGRDVI